VSLYTGITYIKRLASNARTFTRLTLRRGI